MAQVDSMGNVYDGIANVLIPRKARNLKYDNLKINGDLTTDPQGTRVRSSAFFSNMDIGGSGHFSLRTGKRFGISFGGYTTFSESNFGGDFVLRTSTIGGYLSLEDLSARRIVLHDLYVKSDLNMRGISTKLVDGIEFRNVYVDGKIRVNEDQSLLIGYLSGGIPWKNQVDNASVVVYSNDGTMFKEFTPSELLLDKDRIKASKNHSADSWLNPKKRIPELEALLIN